jgi:hypothetical protein
MTAELQGIIAMAVVAAAAAYVARRAWRSWRAARLAGADRGSGCDCHSR